jgi:predicted transcriptional regulator
MRPTHTSAPTPSPEPLVQRTVHLRASHIERLERLAREQERSLTFLVRDAVEAYLAPQSAPERR